MFLPRYSFGRKAWPGPATYADLAIMPKRSAWPFALRSEPRADWPVHPFPDRLWLPSGWRRSPSDPVGRFGCGRVTAAPSHRESGGPVTRRQATSVTSEQSRYSPGGPVKEAQFLTGQFFGCLRADQPASHPSSRAPFPSLTLFFFFWSNFLELRQHDALRERVGFALLSPSDRSQSRARCFRQASTRMSAALAMAAVMRLTRQVRELSVPFCGQASADNLGLYALPICIIF